MLCRHPSKGYTSFPRRRESRINLSEETHYKVIKIVEANPAITQRELAGELGISLGKANYCLKSLIEKGWLKARNFKNNKNKLSYAYLLTPKGVEEKSKLTVRFLKRKVQEYEALRIEIESLKVEVEDRKTGVASEAIVLGSLKARNKQTIPVRDHLQDK